MKDKTTPKLKLFMLACKRCGYKWPPRVAAPVVCPRCRSAYWDRPRRKQKTVKTATVNPQSEKPVKITVETGKVK